MSIKYLMFLSSALLSTSIQADECVGLYNHQFQTLQGKPINLCDYQNKPILVVNTASKCGFTPQFEKLEAIHRKYKDKGLLVIGFPSNDFRQELKTNTEIGSFCKLTYGVEFPMVSKTSVTGPKAHPFYQQLTKETGEAPKWNFHKYVITPGAKTVSSFKSTTEPDDAAITTLIEPFLK